MKTSISRRELFGITLASTTGCMVPQARAETIQIPNSAYPVLTHKTYNSDFFRIPFLLATKNGSLIAGSDANRSTTGDSADNIDVVFRRKAQASSYDLKDGWSAPQPIEPLEMSDFSPMSSYAQTSASVIDGAIVQDHQTGRILLLIDAFAWNGGVFEHLNVNSDNSVRGGRARTMPIGDGFATVQGRPMLLLSDANIKGSADGKIDNINLNTDRSKFNFVADVEGEKDSMGMIKVYQLQGTPRPYTANGVDDSNLSLGEPSNFTLDKNLVVHKDGIPLISNQQDDIQKTVPMRIFYKDSVLQIFNTNHVIQVFSDDDGLTWNLDRIVTHEFRANDSRYSLVSPGRAVQIQQGEYQGRILIPTYTQLASGIEFIAMYSDDLGASWHRSQPLPGETSMHETAIIEVSTNALRSFHRHSSSSGGKVLTAESIDGGRTWSTLSSAFGDNDPGVGCQVSALILKDKKKSPTTGEYLTTIAVTTAMDRTRVNGVVHVGLIHLTDETSIKTRIEWISQYEITNSSTPFAYSSMDQLYDGRVIVLYETSSTTSWAEGLKNMYIQELPIL